MKIEMNQFRDVFFEECAEHLAALETELLGLESASDASEALKRIFRAAHTIKGGAGMFGLDRLSRFTHTMESLLDRLRNGEIQPEPRLVDLLLRSGDVLKALVASARSGGEPPAEVEAVQFELEQANRITSHPSGPSTPSAVAPPAPTPMAEKLWRIRFTPEPGSLKRGMEPLLVLHELSGLGTTVGIEINSSQLPALEDLDPGECFLGWNLTFQSAYPREAIEEVFAFVEKDTEYHISELVLENALPQEAPVSSLPPLQAKQETQEVIMPQEPVGRAGESLAEAARKVSSIGESTIRVDVDLLDRLMNVVGELVLARNQILQFASGSESSVLNGASQRLNLITSELQEGVMKTRMQPIGMVWGIMPRLVRDLAATSGKRIRLEMEGAETELDRTLLEAMKDPLTHIVRNACDHGIERPEVRERAGKPAEGRLLLRAYHEGGHVIVEMADDGAGIDPAKVKAKALERGLISTEQSSRMSDRDIQQLLFLPGFSTAEKITDISGRGVGMDVVKTNIEKIGGAIDLASRPGQGTTVRLKIPLTLAIIPGLVVTSGGERFVIPQMNLVELVRLEGESGRKQIESVHHSPVYRRRGTLLPLAYLNRVLTLPQASGSDVINMVVLQAEDRAFGLVVDAIHDTQEIVVKPMGKQLKGLGCYSGSTIMGDGHVSLILDVLGIAQRAGLLAENRQASRAGAESAQAAAVSAQQRLLLFRAAGFARLAVPLSLVARLEEFPHSRIEHPGRGRVVQYRERILPLLSLGEVLGRGDSSEFLADPAAAIVFANGDSSVGLVVDEILDIVEEEIRVRDHTQKPGLLGSGIVDGKVTDFLDLRPVIDAAGSSFWNEGCRRQPRKVLVADRSAFHRALLRNDLEMAGYIVIEASTLPEATEKLRQGIDVLAADLDLIDAPGASSRPLRQQAAESGVRVLSLVAEKDQAGTSDDMLWKFDRAGMLKSIERLAEAVKSGVNALV